MVVQSAERSNSQSNSGNATTEWLAVSYLTLRRVIGLMGVLLPVILVIGCLLVVPRCDGLEPSISAYYGTVMRNIFVGLLFVIGWFLFSYKGYERRDDLAGDLACLFALGVALFPATSETTWVKTIHYTSAGSLFLTLAYFSMVLFTKSDGLPTPKKQTRNKVYVGCGVLMLSCIVLLVIYNVFFKGSAIDAVKPVLILETLLLWAFGVSWMTKGEMLWRDVQN